MKGDVKVRGGGINGRGWQTYQVGRVRIAANASRAGDGERVWREIGTSFEVGRRRGSAGRQLESYRSGRPASRRWT